MPGHLETLLAFDRQYQRDQQQSPAFLHRRDRRYALDQDDSHKADIRHWLAQLQALNDTTSATYPTELRFWQRFASAFVSLGALLGIVTMSGLLFYDGGQQISITVILGVILLQLVLALITASQGLAGWQPWAPLVHSLQHRLEKRQPSPALMPLFSPLMARTAQAAGLAFGVTGLITLLASVVLQDLAFGWSTTLETSAEAWHGIVSWVAAPWSGWLPVATPSLELVSDTRFFRLEDATDTDSARWGAWWPFVAMAWLTWTILPRLLLLILATLDLRRKSRHALRHHPGYPALLWRMETPAVETGSDTTDSGQLPADASTNTVPVPDTPLIVCWAGASPEKILPEPPAPMLRAGGSQSLQADRSTLADLASRRGPGDRDLLVVTRAWEPPTAELEDFLEEAVMQFPDIRLALLPIATNPAQRPSDQQLAQWLRFADRAGQGIRVAATDNGEANHVQH